MPPRPFHLVHHAFNRVEFNPASQLAGTPGDTTTTVPPKASGRSETGDFISPDNPGLVSMSPPAPW
jgi:hypothetical protein